MFSILDRYIARQVINASLLILFLLTCLRSLFSLLDELGDIGEGQYILSDALLYVGLMIPDRILEFFPMSVLIGALFAMGNLASHSELTVMRAAGITTWRIAGATIKASVILMIVVIIIGEFLAPITTKAASQLRTSAISGGELSFSKTGLWAKQGNKVIQISNILSDGKLSGVTIYQLKDNAELEKVIQAKRAEQTTRTWQLLDVTELEFTNEAIVTQKFARKIWSEPLREEQIETLTLQPEALNLIGLISYMSYLNDNNLRTEEYELALWRKIVQPFAIAVMMFLAVSFVFGPMRSISMGARILSGVMLGFVFHLANQSFGPISLIYNFSPFVGAFLPALIFASLAYWLMRRNS